MVVQAAADLHDDHGEGSNRTNQMATGGVSPPSEREGAGRADSSRGAYAPRSPVLWCPGPSTAPAWAGAHAETTGPSSSFKDRTGTDGRSENTTSTASRARNSPAPETMTARIASRRSWR